MEGYARHSRSQFRAAAPLPPSSAGAAFYNKSCTNDATAGRSGFMAYDDVFGGPPKFGATPFAPRAEDYSEIFESFRSGRASSIPMLDLPPVDDSVSAFEALGCSGFDYSEIFGGFEFADFAVTYDELFRRSDASDESSDDAWTPVGTESLSGESDPYASPGRNQYFLNDDFHDALEENMFNVSYQNVNLGSGEDSELIHEAQVSSVPGYTCVVEGSSMRKEEESIYSSGVADDIILCEDASEKISVETPWKTTSMQSHGCVAKQSRDYDRKDGEAHEISPISSSGSVSDVSLKTDPSQLPPPSRPPTIVERKTFPACSISDYDEQCKSNTAETISEGGSLDLFDVELNAGSSSITSAAAMKEAMDDGSHGTKVRLNNDKELMKRKNDGVKDMPFMNNDFSRDEKVRMVFDESILRDDELQSTHVGESNVVQVYWEEMQDATEALQVLPDPLQPEDAVNGAAESNAVQFYWEVMQDATEPSQILPDPLQPEDAVNGAAESNVVQVYWDDVQDATEASQVLQDPFQPEDAFNGAAEPAQITIAKNLNSSLDPGLTEGDCEWKVTAECYELVTNRKSETETSLLDNINKPVQEMNNPHFGNANGSKVSVKQLKQDMETVDASITKNVDLKSVDEVSGLKENRRRMRATKAAPRNEFHEKMVKVAQNVHGTVISDHVETVKRRKDGPEEDGADWNPEMGLVGEKKETRFDPAAQQLHYEKKHKEECYLAGSEIRSEDDIVLEQCDKKGNEDCWSKENKRIGTEAAAREETPQRVTEVAEREDNGRGLNDSHQTEEKEESCPRKGAEAMKRALSPGDENLSVLNEALEQKEDEGKAGKNETQGSDVRLKKTDGESRERVNEMLWEKETQKADQSKKSVEEATTPDYYGKKLNVFFDPGNYERHDVATEMEQLVHAMEMMYECSAMNNEQKMESKGDLETEFKITGQDNDQETNLQMDTEYFMSSGRSILDETDYSIPETACECEEVKSSNLPTNLAEGDIKSTAMARECEEKLENHAAEHMPMDEEKAELGSSTVFGEMEPKAVDMADICMSTKYLQKTEEGQSKMSEREGNVQKQSLSINTNQRLGKEAKADVGDLDAEAIENAEKLERNEESERERLREIQLEKVRERERELEKEILRKFEEEREREREIELEKEILRKFEEEREREREREFEKEILKKFEEERERERERELEKERLRKVEEEREKELEKLRLRRLEELREREQEKELEKDHLRKLEEERQREREKDLEKERLRKIEEEWEREREREKDRMGNEFKLSAARERASVEARERAERPAVDRATAEARQRAMTEARERLEKACAEAREKSLRKASKEAQLRAERAAVERATAEARERAIEKAMAERATFETRERVDRSASEKFSSSYRNVELRHTSSSNDLWNSSKSNGAEGESNQRCKARLERHHRTVERVAKALAEKNMRDLIAQREQAERNRLAETLDVDIKRWSSGKEGNLRALLSTLQYILGSDSGWQPIPLTEVITSAAVKKAYRKATLCVHPDKLQQRGATIQQKYICEKVFDLLKDAWNRFNSEER